MSIDFSVAAKQQLDPEVLSDLKSAVGPEGWRTAAIDVEPFVTEWRGLYRGETPLVLFPACVAEATEILRICHRQRIAVVPQGGNTGLAGGAIPGMVGAGPQVVLGTGRMRKVRQLDAANYTLTAEAGCILAELQQVAADAGLLFPLSLAAEGSCQLGGNISTNAGGTNVLRYGNTRDLVLGLEVVLPDGRVYTDLAGLRKNNTGYDLKQLFIGAEGTLGLVTAATLKLFPAPQSTATAWLAVRDSSAAVALYAAARASLGDELVAFEYIPRIAVDMVLKHIPATRDPLEQPAAAYVLLEFAAVRSHPPASELLTDFLAMALEKSWINDGCLASNETQRGDFWHLRHSISEAQKHAGASIKHDISVPVSRIPEFMATAELRVKELLPGARPVAFGHLGDGNIHYNLSQPPTMSAREFLDQWAEANTVVHGVAVELGGSFSAEHGIGMLKVAEMERLLPAIHLELMGRIKHAFDPHGIMNPGKVLGMPSID